ncbi:MAG: GYDIA family GHMP kinase [Lutimonas sp.]
MTRYYSHGKLLISGEYLILEGAIGLAVPTVQGQDLVVEETETGLLQWESVDENERTWFTAEFELEDFELLKHSGDERVGEQLQRILRAARKMNSRFLITSEGCRVRTALEFSRNWGLGSSSTLVNNVAKWVDRNPFRLLFDSFGGSGYDIACANSEKPLFYRLEGNQPKAYQVDFDPSFKKNLHFVYLNVKQSSKASIAHFQEVQDFDDQTLDHITAISQELVRSENQEDFNLLLEEHEKIIGSVLGEKPIQQRYFQDFPGQIKSLGAWGGDFVLVSSETNPCDYFFKKGFKTVLPYSKLVL